MRAIFGFRGVSLGLLAALTACQSSFLAGAPSDSPASNVAPDVARVRHLYVATVSTDRRLAIDRFRLRQGIPGRSPDLVHSGFGGLIAVSGDGTLYSTLGYSTGGSVEVDVFPSDESQPPRKIDVAPACGPSSFTLITAIAADKAGNLFALIYSYDGAKPHAVRTPCNGVAVYAPTASGKTRPIQRIRFDAVEFNGLAVDANDNLYVSGNSPSRVEEYSNAVLHPKRTRTFQGAYLGGVRSVATDAAGDVFVANTGQSYTAGWINRYSPSSKGGGPPANTVYLPGSGPHFLNSIAVEGRYLYVDDAKTAVDVYYAHQNGPQSPLYTVAEPKVDSIAAGR